MFLSWVNATEWITFDFADVGLVPADVIDVWTGDDLGNVNAPYSASVEPRGALVYQLFNAASNTVPVHDLSYGHILKRTRGRRHVTSDQGL